MTERKITCDRCEGKGWYFRVPDGFNPFLAGGHTTSRVMYRAPCVCSRAHDETTEPKP